MESIKLKTNVGDHVFEAEGPKDLIVQLYNDWTAIVRARAESAPAPKPPPTNPAAEGNAADTGGSGQVADPMALLFNLDATSGARTLKFPPQRGDSQKRDSVMLLLYGFQIRGGGEWVAATKLSAAIKESGLNIERADRAISTDLANGLVMRRGTGKGGEYRLSNTGIVSARQVGEQLKEFVL